MSEYINIIMIFSIAFITAFFMTPFIKKLAVKVNAIDVPKDGRRVHKKPIPRWGGIGIFSGFVVSVVCFTEIIDVQTLAILAGALKPACSIPQSIER